MNIKISVSIPPELYAAIVDEQALRRKTGVDSNGKRVKTCTLSSIVTEWLYKGFGVRPKPTKATVDERAIALTRAEDRCLHCGTTRGIILQTPQGGCSAAARHLFPEDTPTKAEARALALDAVLQGRRK